PARRGGHRGSRGGGRCRRVWRRAGLASPYPQAGPFPHRFALGDRSGSARERVPSPIASLWGTGPVSTGGAGEGVGSTQGSLPQLCWGSTGEAGEGVGAPDVGVSRVS